MTTATSTNSKASNNATTTPFQSIFLSATRPIRNIEKNNEKNDDTNHPQQQQQQSPSSSSYTPYTILFQHSTKLNQRIIASEPLSNKSDMKKVYDNAGIERPQEMNAKNNTGSLFVEYAWKECVKRCHGHVILIQTLGNTSFDWGLASSSSPSCSVLNDHNENFKTNKNRLENDLFQKHGVLIDLYTDPLGWDEGSDDDNDGDGGGGDDNHDTNTSFKAQTHDLKSLYNCIYNATNHIQKVKEEEQKQQQQYQPIPIIFDSISSLLLHHGVHKFSIFLSQLKRQFHSTNNHTITSPIFLPTTMELLSPEYNQVLEDYADTTLSLYNGKLHIAKRSAKNHGGMIYPGLSGGMRLVKDIQYFELDRSKKILILRNSPSTKKDLDGNDDDDDDDDKNGKESKNVEECKNDANNDSSSSSNSRQGTVMTTDLNERHHHQNGAPKKKSIHLQHETVAPSKTTPVSQGDTSHKPLKSVPRIFIEENDPEYDDLDEEDPDDDLDI